jgi:propionyl-CoA carboxylase alpha chain
MMFKKILIANRGEIACRIIKAARKMGIKTVAVYSDADHSAQHVRMANEAVHIGASAAGQSYLSIEKILGAVKQTGADAVHPGYGFLSENARFAETLQEAGIAFIGPSVAAIRAMGDKIESKKIAAKAGVATVPGQMDLIRDAEHAVTIAKEIGYPVMIKASAGGGGKGMRIARSDSEALEGFGLARNEAQSSFGDDRIFIEKFVEEPRHIEIQVLGDHFGNCISLGERECSIQRRNQKVIEEAPSPFLDVKTRKAMGEQAVALAKAVGYASAGTVEFIVDRNRNFYFLEMNTRLQVEHPVTELVTGVDIVEQMIRIAAGEKLGLTQADVKLNGWAIESRIYAEDPYRNFLPSIGRLTRYRPPSEGQRLDGSILRNDTGVDEGGEISIYYDPMIAKLCAWGETRGKAITAMAAALDEFEVEGVGNNVPFLSAVVGHKRFLSGDINTAFVADEYPAGFSGAELDGHDRDLFSIIACFIHVQREQRAAQTSGIMENHRRVIGREWVVNINKESRSLAMDCASQPNTVSVNKAKAVVVESDWQPGQTLGRFRIDGLHYVVKVNVGTKGIRLRRRGHDVTVQVRSPRHAVLAQLMPKKIARDVSKLLLCPMPGLLRSILVQNGDSVEVGQALAVVEAMKMENVLRAERAGTIKHIAAAQGQSLQVDELILEFD